MRQYDEATGQEVGGEFWEYAPAPVKAKHQPTEGLPMKIETEVWTVTLEGHEYPVTVFSGENYLRVADAFIQAIWLPTIDKETPVNGAIDRMPKEYVTITSPDGTEVKEVVLYGHHKWHTGAYNQEDGV